MKVAVCDEEYTIECNISESLYNTFKNDNIARSNFIKFINLQCDTNFDNSCKIIDITNAHVCKYCGNIVNTNDAYELCDDCKSTFGHKYYTEL